jgi:hypothetical protein
MDSRFRGNDKEQDVFIIVEKSDTGKRNLSRKENRGEGKGKTLMVSLYEREKVPDWLAILKFKIEIATSLPPTLGSTGSP